jgi:hypothetical protein
MDRIQVRIGSTGNGRRTRRSYSLSRFFTSRTPTVVMETHVATGSYIVN